jgi:hypothetical protein
MPFSLPSRKSKLVKTDSLRGRLAFNTACGLEVKSWRVFEVVGGRREPALRMWFAYDQHSDVIYYHVTKGPWWDEEYLVESARRVVQCDAGVEGRGR